MNTQGDWAGVPFGKGDDEDVVSNAIVAETKRPTNLKRQFFRLKLLSRPEDQEVVSFTIRFRGGPEESWKWMRDQTSLPDGHLCYQRLQPKDTELSHYFKNFNKELKVHNEASQNAAGVYTVSTLIDGAKGEDSAYREVKMGVVAGFVRFFAVVRLWAPWIAPRHGREKFEIDKDAILLAFLRKDGMHVVILAVSGLGEVQTHMTSDGEGNLILHGRNDAKEEAWGSFIVAVGTNFEEANAAAMYEARRRIMATNQVSDEVEKEIKALEEGPKPQWLEEWYDGFSYCTWNGLGQDLNEQKIFDALKSLRDNNINITNLIIDDNWQSLDSVGEGQSARRWLEFEANKEGFPNGIKHTATEIRKQNPNVKHIAVWHALLGYWGAISPDGKIAKDYKTMKVRKAPGVTGAHWTVVHPDDVDRFYDDFYSFLSSSGIDSVKTDAQFSLDEIIPAPQRAALNKPYQDAWSIAMLKHFSAKAISCMSQAPQIIYHSQLPTNRPRLMVRNSDDFFPDIEDSHPWHVFCNAYNTLFTQHLNALPDWDMFQTSHPWADFHAAARCVSGGPIYFTDTPGKHDVDLIYQMTANTIRGDTVILRPSTLGRSISPYLGYDEAAFLKIGTYHGAARTGTSIIGVFNTTQHTLTEIIPLTDFSGTEEGLHVIRAHKSGRCTKPISRKKAGYNFVSLELGKQGWDTLSAYAMYGPHGTVDGKDTYIANLGLLGKITGAAGVVNTTITSDKNWNVKLWTSLKALGTLGES